MTPEDKAVLFASLSKPAPDYAVHNLEDVCKRTGLDWRLRHVYLIERGGKWRVELSIDGFRSIAGSQHDYDGQDGPYFTMGPEGPWTDIPPDKEPYAAKVGVRRKGQSNPTYATAKFKDYQTGQMYKKFPSTMTAKVAEMLALRKAFPGVLGGLYGAEEMEQAGTGKAVAAKPTPKVTSPVPAASSAAPPGTSTADADEETDETYLAFLLEVAACTTLDEVKKVGAKIAASHLGMPLKMKLSTIYKAKKAELE